MSKAKTRAGRRAARERDTSEAVRPSPGGFVVNEFLENRLALRDRDFEKYLRETSEPMRLTVERVRAAQSGGGRARRGPPPADLIS